MSDIEWKIDVDGDDLRLGGGGDTSKQRTIKYSNIRYSNIKYSNVKYSKVK